MVRKYVLSTGVIGALFGIIPVIRASRDKDRDWRLALVWASWLITAALAVAEIVTVAKENELEP